MRGFLYLFLATMVSLTTSCDTGVSSNNVTVRTNQIPRFEVHLQGKFEAGYANSEREILIIKDTKTGVEYLGITDVSLTKMIQKEREEDAAEVLENVIDIATEIAGD